MLVLLALARLYMVILILFSGVLRFKCLTSFKPSNWFNGILRGSSEGLQETSIVSQMLHDLG